jgi:hypothetical protein
MDFERAQRERDKRLRRLLLMAMDSAKAMGPTGELNGITLRDVVVAGLPDAEQFEDDTHCIALIRELVGKGMAQERRRTLRRGERFGLVHMQLKITDRGAGLLRERPDIPQDPDIDDERIAEEA